TELDDSGMLADFGEIKRKIQEWIEENLDHAVILNKRDPLAKILSELGEKLFLTESNPTAETIARTILEQAIKQGLPAIRVQLWESANCYATCEIPRKNICK
ncbi:MAG: 6-carboxytetrahydropterin synthase, partial [Candidatus Nanoarchaeia archaeon]